MKERELRDRLKEYRVNRGYSQAGLAEHLTNIFEYNVSTDTIKNWENNRTMPKIQTMARLRDLLEQAGIE